MLDALSRSGYLLEHRLEKVIKEKGFLCQPNSAYEDIHTGKSREIDIVGYRQLTREVEGGEKFEYDIFLQTVLIIECVNNPQPLIVFGKDRDSEEERLSPTSPAFLSHYSASSTALLLARGAFEEHHYAEGNFPTQYCSFTQKGKGNSPNKEWMVHHPEESTGDILKLCDELLHEKSKIDEYGSKDKVIVVHLYYPIFVLQNELILLYQENDLVLQSVDHTLLKQSIARNGQFHTVIMDIVTEQGFPVLLDKIIGELDALETLVLKYMDSTKQQSKN